MADAKSLLHIDSEVFSSYSADVDTRRCVSRANRHLCVLRTMEGPRVSIVLAMKVILVFSLVTSLGKYRIENAYLYFIDCSIENGCSGILEKWRKVTSAFIAHRI